MQDSSSVLKSLVLPLLDGAAQEYAARWVGFPDCMVSRVVPVAAESPLELVAEDYNEWTVNVEAFVGPPLDLPAMELVADQETRLARKFFMHNGAHAVCGYWGFHRGHTYVHEAIADPVVRDHVLAAIDELAAVVARRYDLDLGEVRDYGLTLGARGAVAQLKDLILRVVRDPLRKLSRPERFTAPAELALEYGLDCHELTQAMAAALRYHDADDPQSLAMQEQLRSEGAQAAIQGILGLPEGHPLTDLVVAAYDNWTPPGPA
jgi:mannitol-1-phosphate 5-dehydrogenase